MGQVRFVVDEKFTSAKKFMGLLIYMKRLKLTITPQYHIYNTLF